MPVSQLRFGDPLAIPVPGWPASSLIAGDRGLFPIFIMSPYGIIVGVRDCYPHFINIAIRFGGQAIFDTLAKQMLARYLNEGGVRNLRITLSYPAAFLTQVYLGIRPRFAAYLPRNSAERYFCRGEENT